MQASCCFSYGYVLALATRSGKSASAGVVKKRTRDRRVTACVCCFRRYKELDTEKIMI